MDTASSSFRAAERIGRIKPSPSTAAAARVRELKAEGRRILDLTVGEPDFDTPDHIKRAAIAAIEAGETKYTPVNGTPLLREAIRGSLLRTHGIEYSDAEITVGGGGKQVISLGHFRSAFEGILTGRQCGEQEVRSSPEGARPVHQHVCKKSAYNKYTKFRQA